MIPETMIHDQHCVKLARIKEEVLYFKRWRIFTDLVIDQCWAAEEWEERQGHCDRNILDIVVFFEIERKTESQINEEGLMLMSHFKVIQFPRANIYLLTHSSWQYPDTGLMAWQTFMTWFVAAYSWYSSFHDNVRGGAPEVITVPWSGANDHQCTGHTLDTREQRENICH